MKGEGCSVLFHLIGRPKQLKFETIYKVSNIFANVDSKYLTTSENTNIWEGMWDFLVYLNVE